MSSSYLMYAELRSRFHSKLWMLVEANLVALWHACFEFASEVPEDVQHDNLANLRVGAFSSHFSIGMLRPSQPPHQGPRTNPVLRAGA